MKYMYIGNRHNDSDEYVLVFGQLDSGTDSTSS